MIVVVMMMMKMMMNYLDDWLTTESTIFPDRNVARGSHQRKLTTHS